MTYFTKAFQNVFPNCSENVSFPTQFLLRSPKSLRLHHHHPEQREVWQRRCGKAKWQWFTATSVWTWHFGDNDRTYAHEHIARSPPGLAIVPGKWGAPQGPVAKLYYFPGKSTFQATLTSAESWASCYMWSTKAQVRI